MISFTEVISQSREFTVCDTILGPCGLNNWLINKNIIVSKHINIFQIYMQLNRFRYNFGCKIFKKLKRNLLNSNQTISLIAKLLVKCLLVGYDIVKCADMVVISRKEDTETSYRLCPNKLSDTKTSYQTFVSLSSMSWIASSGTC